MTCKVNNKNLNYITMKKKLFFGVALLIFSFALYASEGIDLCNSVYSILKKNNFAPLTQNLVTSGENTFPYNITVDFSPSNSSQSQQNEKHLLLVFYQEDVPENEKSLIKLLNFIRKNSNEHNFDFNTTVLFAYGERQLQLENFVMIYGTETFIKAVNTNEDYTALIFDLNNKENQILISSNGTTSPSWLIKNSCNLYLKASLKEKLPFYFLSQIYSLKVFNNRELDLFFKNNIPAIKLCLKNNVDDETVFSILKDSVSSFSSTTNRLWDHHFLIVNFFGRYRRLSESAIVKIIIFISFAWLLFLFIFAFINQTLKRHTWASIKQIWYSIPITFALIFLSFVFSRLLFKGLNPNFSDAGIIFTFLTFQLLTSLFFSSIFELFILLFKFGFGERAIDYLLVIFCFINQSLFILVDISLFPIFMFICLLSIAALLIKNNFIHICIFILMILPLIPYAHTVLLTSEISDLRNFIFSNQLLPFSLSLVMYPLYLVLFRIFTSIRSHLKSSRTVIISLITGFMIIAISLSTLSVVRIRQINSRFSETTIIINQSSVSQAFAESSTQAYAENFSQVYAETFTQNSPQTALSNPINVFYEDKYVFSDIIRTVEIDLNFDSVLCSLKLEGDTSTPVLYTDNDYETLSPTTISFKIPNNPPGKMRFSYGASKDPCCLTVTALAATEQNHIYSLITKTVLIDGEK